MCDDDPSIDGPTRLFRRVHQNFVKRDEDRGCTRLTSAAFQDAELSVDLEDSLQVDPATLLDAYPGFSLVSFDAQAARDAGLVVCRDAQPENPAHGLVVGRKTGSKKRRLAEASRWEIPPDDPCEPPYS